MLNTKNEWLHVSHTYFKLNFQSIFIFCDLFLYFTPRYIV